MLSYDKNSFKWHHEEIYYNHVDKGREEMKDIADQIYWLLINEGQNYICSMPLGQRMFLQQRT
jgi:hypothetical protein